MKLRGLPWAGGKSGSHERGKWVASLVKPPTPTQAYCEPFAGMLGVLLQRVSAGVEIINDIDSRLMNFWRCVREHPYDLHTKMVETPWAEKEFEWAKEAQWDLSLEPLERARAFAMICLSPHARKEFVVGWGTGETPPRIQWNDRHNFSWGPVADRLVDVIIYERDALEVLEMSAKRDHAMVYADPPYAGTFQESYGGEAPTHDNLRDALLSQKGDVAISGYGDEWDCLGWQRHELTTFSTLGTTDVVKGRERVEVVWTSYLAATQERLF